MKAMRVEMAFFDGDELLARSIVLIHKDKDVCEVISGRGDKFVITRWFEEPASVVQIEYFDPDGEFAGRSAMRMGVHNSEEWEAIQLADPYELCFRTAIVDDEDPNWDKCDPWSDK